MTLTVILIIPAPSYKRNELQAMHGAPLYIAETCPSQIRGTLVSLKELFIVLGILVLHFPFSEFLFD